MHKCYIESTRSERFSDTVQFQHKNITNPTITHGDKIVYAISRYTKVIQSLGGGMAKQEIKDLRWFVEATRSAVSRDPNFMDREVSSDTQ